MALLGLDTLFKKTLFCGYMLLWVTQGMLVYGSRDANGKLPYNSITVVMLVSLTKLCIAANMYLRDNGSFTAMRAQATANLHIWALYFVPALLYALYDNLAFVNLQFFDPPTYFILSQFRLVVTGVVYQILFKKRLSAAQWGSLVVLTAGCIVKELPKFTSESLQQVPYLSWGLILVQIFCATFAGVYNETLLKGKDLPMNLQNCFMYFNTIIISLMGLAMGLGGHTLSEAFEPAHLRQVFGNPLVLLIILNMSSMGITTAIFLKHLSSVLKAVASALEIVFTAIASYIVFGTDLGAYTVLSMLCVAFGVYLYSTAPAPKPTGGAVELSASASANRGEKAGDGAPLLPTTARGACGGGSGGGGGGGGGC